MLEVVVGDVSAECDSGDAGEAVVEAGPDARVDDLGAEVVGRVEVLHCVEVAGGPGRNWAPLLRTKGCTFAAHGVCGARNAGGVNRHTPGPGASVGKVDVVPIGVIRPSPVRARMTWLAATKPILCPAFLAWPSGIAASAAA